MPSDLLIFDEPQILALIDVMKDLRTVMQKRKTDYSDRVTNQLSPNWKTDNGQKTVKELLEFANVDIQYFIDYTSDNIANLEKALEHLRIINNS